MVQKLNKDYNLRALFRAQKNAPKKKRFYAYILCF